MTILVLEENLIWSARLQQGLTALGHKAIIWAKPQPALPAADLAIVNLGSRQFPTPEWVPKLKSAGIFILAHAGHKETALMDLGRVAGVDKIVTNGTLTHKLEAVLAACSSGAEIPDDEEEPVN